MKGTIVSSSAGEDDGLDGVTEQAKNMLSDDHAIWLGSPLGSIVKFSAYVRDCSFFLESAHQMLSHLSAPHSAS
jgi:hypothetical protein